MNALSWMDKCIDEEIELNKWNTYFAYHMRKRKRWSVVVIEGGGGWDGAVSDSDPPS